MLAPAPAAPSAQRRPRPVTPAPVLAADEPASTGPDLFASRHRRAAATVEELVARDIEAFSARVRT